MSSSSPYRDPARPGGWVLRWIPDLAACMIAARAGLPILLANPGES